MTRASAFPQRLSPFPRLLLLAAVLFALAVFLVGDGVPPAQASSHVYVSNLGQATAAGTYQPVSSSIAQGFTTGSQTGGYTLGSISVEINGNLSETARDALRAELWTHDSNGGPDAKATNGDLTVPAHPIEAGVVTFTAAANTTLSASTTYYLVVYTVGNSNAPLRTTTSDNEDSGASTGWTIQNDAYLGNTDTAGSTTTWTTRSSIMHIQVEAPPQAATQNPPQNVAVFTGNDKLVLIWQAPSSWADTGWRRFYIQWKLSTAADSEWANVTNDGAYVEFLPNATSFDFTGRQFTQSSATHYVANGTPYDLRIRARSNLDSPVYSAWVTVTATPESVFVSNLSQTAHTALLTTTNRVWASSFTTGSQTGGYPLQSIELYMGVSPLELERDTIRVELWSATTGGAPNQKVESLTAPAHPILGFRTVKFAAPDNTTLSASTTYFVVAYTTGAFNMKLQETRVGNEDPGAAPGWSIGNRSYYVSGNTPGTWVRSTEQVTVKKMRVIGVPPDPTELQDLTVSGSTDGTTFTPLTGASAALPAFDADTTSYRATVGNDVTQVQLGFPRAVLSSKLQVGRSGGGTLTDLDIDLFSHEFSLAQGDNEFTVRVTDANDSANTKDYTVTVRRVPPGTAWHATLEVQVSTTAGLESVLGCDSTQGSAGDDIRCSTATTLTSDDSFTVGTHTNNINILGLDTLQGGSGFRIAFNAAVGDPLKALNFCVGSEEFALSGATATSVAFGSPGFTWAAGDLVSLSIGVSCGEQFLVGNMGQGSPTSLNTGSVSYAQAFTTGSKTGGYTLANIEVTIGNAPTDQQRRIIRAQLWSATTGGAPSAKLRDLIIPAHPVAAGRVPLIAPRTTTLAANTTYFLVVYTTTAFNLDLGATYLDDEDTGGAVGWSIGNTHYTSGNTPGTWTVSTGGTTPAIHLQANAVSNNANLSALIVSGASSSTGAFSAITISPAFSKVTTSYTATVDNGVSHVRFTPTAEDPRASIAVPANGGGHSTVTSGTASPAVALAVGANEMRINVLAEDTRDSKDYDVTITRQAPTVSLSASPDPVDEGQAVTITVALSHAQDQAYTVPLNVSHASPDTAEAADYTASATSVTIASGATSGSLQIQTNHDTGDGDEDETFTVSLGTLPSPLEEGIPASVQVTIWDDEHIPTVRLEAPGQVIEGQSLSVRAVLDRSQGRGLTLPLVIRWGKEFRNGNVVDYCWIDDPNDPDDSNEPLYDGGWYPRCAEQHDVGYGKSWTTHNGNETYYSYWRPSIVNIYSHGIDGYQRIRTSQDGDSDDDAFTVAFDTTHSQWPEGVLVEGASSLLITIIDDDRSGPPSAPLSLRVNEGDASLDLAWHEPLVGSPTGYDVQYTRVHPTQITDQAPGSDPGRGWVQVERSGAETSQAITEKLKNGIMHWVRVRATNAHGASAWASGQGRPEAAAAPEPDYCGQPGSDVIWRATMTVGSYSSGSISQKGFRVSDGTGALTGNSFSYGGRVFTILWLVDHTNPNIPVTDNTLRLALEEYGADSLMTLALHAGDRVFYLADSQLQVDGRTRVWSNANLSWEDGQEVEVYLRVPCASLSSIVVHYDGDPPAEDFQRWQPASPAAFGYRAKVPGEFTSLGPDGRTVLVTHAKVKVGATHATPPRIIWSATLTVHDTAPAVPGVFLGCDDTVTEALCDPSGALTDDSFTYGGMSYGIHLLRAAGSGGEIAFSNDVPAGALDSLALYVNGRPFPLADANGASLSPYTNNYYGLNNPDFPDLTVGDTVQVSLRDFGAGVTLRVGKVTYPNGVRTVASWRSVIGGELSAAIELNAHSPNTGVDIQVTDGSVVRTHFLNIDPPPRTYSLSPGAAVVEGHAAPLILTLSDPAPEGGAEFTVSATYDTAVSGDVGTITSPVTVPAGATSLQIAVPTLDDDLDEDDETFTVTVAPVRAGWAVSPTGTGTATVTIIDNDEAVTEENKYADLIARMYEWRNDPLRSGHQPHVERWDRALLAFGEEVADQTLTPMPASEAQGYADRGWTRWVEVAQALREIEAAAQEEEEQADPPPNSAPTVSGAIADATIVNETGTQQVSLTGTFSDADNDALTISAASSNNAVATASVSAGYASLTVSAQSRGTATITVTANDGNGGTVSDSFTVRVKSAPLLAGAATADVTQLAPGTTQEFSLSGVFTDPDGDTLTISAASSNSGIASVTVAADYSKLTLEGVAEGEAAITVTARDPDGNWVSDRFGVTVVTAPEPEPTNNAPTVAAAIGDATIVNESGTHQVSLSGVFTDADNDALTISAASSNNAVATVSVSGDYSGLTVNAQARGTATVTVTANDGNGETVSDSFTVRVKAAPVVAKAISDVSGLTAGTTQDVSLAGVFADADGDSLTITAASSNNAVATVTVAADYSMLTVAGVAEGRAHVTVTAQDSDGNRVSDAFDVSVEPEPEEEEKDETTTGGPPIVVAPLPDLTLEGPEQRVFDLTLVFQDPDGDKLTFSAKSTNLRVATTLYIQDSTLTVRSTGTGTATITVTARDPDGNEVSDSFVVTVSPAG